MLYPDDVNYWKEVAEKYSDALAEMVEAKDELKEELETMREEWSDMKDEHMKITADMKQIQHLAKGW